MIQSMRVPAKAHTTPVIDPPQTEPKPDFPAFTPQREPQLPHQPAPRKEPSPFTPPGWAKPGEEPAPKAVGYAKS
jgi:hypothetical protein